jgi:hypothetical protein
MSRARMSSSPIRANATSKTRPPQGGYVDLSLETHYGPEPGASHTTCDCHARARSKEHEHETSRGTEDQNGGCVVHRQMKISPSGVVIE